MGMVITTESGKNNNEPVAEKITNKQFVNNPVVYKMIMKK